MTHPTMIHVYVSGPMTGLPQLNFPAFHAAAVALRAHGLLVTNPAELNPDPSASWADCMRADIKALCDCDGLVLLPGWQESKGAHIELNLAHRLQMKVATLEQMLADDAALAAYWAAAAHQQAAATPVLLADRLAELAVYFRAELDNSRGKAAKWRQRGDIERQRRSQAAAQAWARAVAELEKLEPLE